MDCILITGGEIPHYSNVKELFKDQYICVADSGLDWVLENDIDFDHIVGDMDSLKNSDCLKNIPITKKTILPTEKDDTDTVFALKYLKDLGATKISVIGGGGGRLDHLLGIVSIFETVLAPDEWFTNKEHIIFANGMIDLKDYQGCSISVYPLGKVVCSITSYGLKWDLNKVDWGYKSIGISNSIELDNAWVDTINNTALIILPIEGKSFE